MKLSYFHSNCNIIYKVLTIIVKVVWIFEWFNMKNDDIHPFFYTHVYDTIVISNSILSSCLYKMFICIISYNFKTNLTNEDIDIFISFTLMNQYLVCLVCFDGKFLCINNKKCYSFLRTLKLTYILSNNL